MSRRTDWYTRYVAFIEDMRQKPFEWGTADCGPAWAGQLIEVVTERDNPVAETVGTYKSRKGALQKMKKLGYDNLKDAAESILGIPSQHPSMGAIGDLALIKTDDKFGYSFGVVNGERVFFRREDGIGTTDLLEAECIFKL